MQNFPEKIGFGGGCHWCTEAVFDNLHGVDNVSQGFIRSEPPADDFSEAVLLNYGSDVIPLQVLVEIHLRTHASTSRHKLRSRYRSAVYTFDEVQSQQVAAILHTLQCEFESPLITEVMPFVAFKPSDERYQRYYQNTARASFVPVLSIPNCGYCSHSIRPTIHPQ